MPLALDISHKILQVLADERRAEGGIEYLRPDAKSQVTIEYSDNNEPIRIDTIVVSTQHVPARIFLLISNLFFVLERKSIRFRLTNLEIPGEFFAIVDKNSDSIKYFGFRKQGYMVFQNGIRNRGETLVKDYSVGEIDFKPNDRVIDIGANTGDFKIIFENLNLDVKYYAIEPGIKEFQCLTKNLSNEEEIFNFAIGDQDGELEFYYNLDYGDSSLVEMADFRYTYKTQTLKLSSFFEKHIKLSDNGRVKLLKLEAEGFEPEIIMNSGNFLSKIDYIAADLGFERGIEQESTAPEVINFLLINGFKIVKVNGERFTFLFKNINAT